MSKKWCKIDTLLLHTTNRKYHMAYRFMPFPMTLKVIRLLQDLSDISGGFNWHDTSRSPSAIVELLVLNSVYIVTSTVYKWNGIIELFCQLKLAVAQLVTDMLQSFAGLSDKPLMVDLTVEEGQRLKVVYGSSRGFHAIDLDTSSVFDIYIPAHVSFYVFAHIKIKFLWFFITERNML